MIKCFCDRCGKEIKEQVNIIPIYAYDGLGNKIVSFYGKHLCEECSAKLDEIKDQLKYEEDIFDMSDEDIELLRYTFKVGDKVILSDGLVGTIKEICTCDRCKERGFYEARVEMEDGSTDCIMKTDKERGFDAYYSIGDKVFGNLKEEYVVSKMDEAWKNHTQFVRQLGLIRILKEKGWSANEI